MPDTFAITIIFIVTCTILGAFVKGRSRDRCLMDLDGCPVTLERVDGKKVWGTLKVYHSGVELLYKEPYTDPTEGHIENSYILYKDEFSEINYIVRDLAELDKNKLDARNRVLKSTCRHGFTGKPGRRIRNFFGTVRDSLLEIVNLMMGRMKSATPAGKFMQGQDKYISQVQQQTVTAFSSAYEPILERYIGKRVVIDYSGGETKREYTGILRDYTTDFIVLLDVEETKEEVDIVLPRGKAIVRHRGAKEKL